MLGYHCGLGYHCLSRNRVGVDGGQARNIGNGHRRDLVDDMHSLHEGLLLLGGGNGGGHCVRHWFYSLGELPLHSDED